MGTMAAFWPRKRSNGLVEIYKAQNLHHFTVTVSFDFSYLKFEI